MKRILSIFIIAWPILIIAQPIGIIPQPVSIHFTAGSFIINNYTSIHFNPANKDLRSAVDFFNSYIKSVSGKTLSINKKNTKTIEFKLAKTSEIGILFLFSNDSYTNAVTIQQAQMKSEGFAELFEFVKCRFNEKK